MQVYRWWLATKLSSHRWWARNLKMKTRIQDEASKRYNWDFVLDQASESCLPSFNLMLPSLPPSGSATQVTVSSCAQPSYQDGANPVHDLLPHPTSTERVCNPNPTNSLSSTTTFSTYLDVVFLPDGTQMVLGEKPPLELPTPASEFEFIFKMMDVVREERKFLNPPPTVSRGEDVLQPRKVPGGEKQPDGSFLNMFGLGQPQPNDSERERRKSGQRSWGGGGDENAGGGGPGPPPPGGSTPGTPVGKGW